MSERLTYDILILRLYETVIIIVSVYTVNLLPYIRIIIIKYVNKYK